MQGGANPIRKIVTMLQNMQKKVEEEGAKEKTLFEQFMCYCQTGKDDLSESITSATNKIPALESSIEASEGKLAQAKEDLKGAQQGREMAKKDLAEANAIREKEASTFAKEKAEAETNIAALAKAIAALEKGLAGGFLQTGAADVLRRLANQASSDLLEEDDRQSVLAFLSGSQSSDYAPASGEIVGILKQMYDSMRKDLADTVQTEKDAIASHAQLVSAKKREMIAQTSTIEAKTQQIGELGVEIVQSKEDADDTAKALAADKKYLAELELSCKTKAAEWDERSKMRAEELVALGETVKVLNDDDALDLFKKTLPSPAQSFLQVAISAKDMRRRAVAAIREAKRTADHHTKAALDAVLLALSGKKALNQGAFDKVVTMVDDMVSVLKKEQVDDDNKKAYCKAQFDEADDSKKALQRAISDKENAIASAKEMISTITEEIAALAKGIKALDAAVAEGTRQRKADSQEFKEMMASNGAAKELLAFAKNRLNKFYNKKLHKAAPKQELSEADRIESGVTGTEPPTEAPGGIADTGITADFVQVRSKTARGAPPPPPETFGAYTTKSEESSGVIAMVDLLIKDLQRDMTEAKVEEANAQKDYEEMMRESTAKRAADAKSLTQKEGQRADIETDLQNTIDTKSSKKKELHGVEEYIMSLHQECDWLLKYFDTRKTARAGEIDSLNKAKDVLRGADYSFLQTGVAHRVLRRMRMV